MSRCKYTCSLIYYATQLSLVEKDTMLNFARPTTRFVNSVAAGPFMRTVGIETEERFNE